MVELAGIPVVVDRQKDIAAEVAKKVAMAKAVVVVITYEGFSNPDERMTGGVTVTRRYSVTIYARPILAEVDAIPADDVVEYVTRRIHNWDPAEDVAGFVTVNVTGCDLVPNTKHLIYDLDVEAQCRM